jgi:hypothetical protein
MITRRVCNVIDIQRYSEFKTARASDT